MHSLHRLASRATRLRRFQRARRRRTRARGGARRRPGQARRAPGSLSSSWEACELGGERSPTARRRAHVRAALALRRRARVGARRDLRRGRQRGRRDRAHVRAGVRPGGAAARARARPLVAHAIGVATAAHGAERIAAVARLPGSARGSSRRGVGRARRGRARHDAAGAVEAVARGVPRPGHSVLGQGTFAAAQPAFERLATRFAEERLATDADAEVGAFLSAGASRRRALDARQVPPALRDSGGCTAELPVAGVTAHARAALAIPRNRLSPKSRARASPIPEGRLRLDGRRVGDRLVAAPPLRETAAVFGLLHRPLDEVSAMLPASVNRLMSS